ncbi:DUF4258 domain-containing protein [Candidatus Woesearchaeota archaeon]|nr:DUF4258 domain-containing protein [Candidatus Woesearchaeota archaeon]
MDLSKYDVVIKRHAFMRALERGVHPDLIEAALQKGRVERFGKHGIKFVSKGSKRTIVCIGEIAGSTIKIITVEEGN